MGTPVPTPVPTPYPTPPPQTRSPTPVWTQPPTPHWTPPPAQTFYPTPSPTPKRGPVTTAPTPQQTWQLNGGGLSEKHVWVRNEMPPRQHNGYSVERSSPSHRSWFGKLWDHVTGSAPAPTPPPQALRSQGRARMRERAAFRAFQRQAAAQRQQAQRRAHSRPSHRYTVQRAALGLQQHKLKMLRQQAARLQAAARIKRERERRAQIQRFNAATDHALSRAGQSAIPFQPPGMLRREERESGGASVTYSDRPPTL